MESNSSPTRVRLSDTLFTTIRASVDTDPNGEVRIALYTSFGVVRGTVSATTFGRSNQAQDARLENTSRVLVDPDLLELEGVVIEHYSNHLPTANFPTLFVRLDDIRGFAVERR
jgi:hypothetical protein